MSLYLIGLTVDVCRGLFWQYGCLHSITFSWIVLQFNFYSGGFLWYFQGLNFIKPLLWKSHDNNVPFDLQFCIVMCVYELWSPCCRILPFSRLSFRVSAVLTQFSRHVKCLFYIIFNRSMCCSCLFFPFSFPTCKIMLCFIVSSLTATVYFVIIINVTKPNRQNHLNVTF